MILIHNSYEDPSPYLLSRAGEDPQSRRMVTGIPTDQSDLTALPPGIIPLFKSMRSTAAVIDALRPLAVQLILKNISFLKRLESVCQIARTWMPDSSGEKLDVGLPRTLFFKHNPFVCSDIMGLATLIYLRSNRGTRHHMNDVILGAILTRENGLVPQKIESILCPHGFSMDADSESDSRTALAVGLTMKHFNFFEHVCHGLNIKDDASIQNAFIALGRAPWWFQILFMQAGLLQATFKHNWMAAKYTPKIPFSASSSSTESRYPYLYYGQPGLRKRPLNTLMPRSFWKNMQENLPYMYPSESRAELTPQLNLMRMLTLGVPESLPTALFNSTVVDKNLIDLLAGVSNKQFGMESLSEYPKILGGSGHVTYARELLRNQAFSGDLSVLKHHPGHSVSSESQTKESKLGLFVKIDYKN